MLLINIYKSSHGKHPSLRLNMRLAVELKASAKAFGETIPLPKKRTVASVPESIATMNCTPSCLIKFAYHSMEEAVHLFHRVTSL